MTKEDIIATLYECEMNSEAFRPFVTDDEIEFIADRLISYHKQYFDQRIKNLKASIKAWRKLMKMKPQDYQILQDKIKEIKGAIKECEYLKERL